MDLDITKQFSKTHKNERAEANHTHRLLHLQHTHDEGRCLDGSGIGDECKGEGGVFLSRGNYSGSGIGISTGNFDLQEIGDWGGDWGTGGKEDRGKFGIINKMGKRDGSGDDHAYVSCSNNGESIGYGANGQGINFDLDCYDDNNGHGSGDITGREDSNVDFGDNIQHMDDLVHQLTNSRILGNQ